MSKHELPVVLHNETRGLLTIEEDKLSVLQLTADGRPPKCLLSCPTRLFLRGRLTSVVPGKPRRLELFALGQKGAKSTHLHLRKIHVLVEPAHHAAADEWVELLMKLAYPVTRPFRRVLLLVNPVGGKGKARTIVHEQVMPLLEAAGCKVDRIETTHSKHAEEIASTADLTNYDVIATASGDGNVYEILNGLAMRPENGRRALRTPIAPLPTGSACAACTNIFGVKDTFNIALATLNVIKGQPLAVDLCSILLLPSMERRLSFLSTALGLMVDLDIGTEHLRWMGDTRFVYGFVRGVMMRKPCKARIRIDVITDNKEEMAKVAREAAAKEMGAKKVMGGGTNPLALVQGVQVPPPRDAATFGALMASKGSNGTTGSGDGSDVDRKLVDAAEDDESDGALPPQLPLQPTSDWITIESSGTGKKSKRNSTIATSGANGSNGSSSSGSDYGNPDTKHGNWESGHNMLYFYAGLMPWVSRDLNQWPVVRAGSGMIDIVIQRIVPRVTLLNGIASAEYGDAFWEDSQHYYKARAFTVENLDKVHQPMFTIDGEAFPWDSFHVEVLPRAATFLSLDGRFYHSRFVSTDSKGKKEPHSKGKK